MEHHLRILNVKRHARSPNIVIGAAYADRPRGHIFIPSKPCRNARYTLLSFTRAGHGQFAISILKETDFFNLKKGETKLISRQECINCGSYKNPLQEIILSYKTIMRYYYFGIRSY